MFPSFIVVWTEQGNGGVFPHESCLFWCMATLPGPGSLRAATLPGCGQPKSGSLLLGRGPCRVGCCAGGQQQHCCVSAGRSRLRACAKCCLLIGSSWLPAQLCRDKWPFESLHTLRSWEMQTPNLGSPNCSLEVLRAVLSCLLCI